MRDVNVMFPLTAQGGGGFEPSEMETVDADIVLTGAEKVANKVTSLSSSSTNTEYPSAKCVYDLLQNVGGNAMPTPPTTDGTYKLTVTVSNGTPTYAWVAES